VRTNGEDHDDGVVTMLIKCSALKRRKRKQKAQGKGET
jgi:gluconate kinase